MSQDEHTSGSQPLYGMTPHFAGPVHMPQANMDSLLFGQQPLRQLNVAVTPNCKEQAGVILLLCHDLDSKPPREIRVSISCERALIWKETTGIELQEQLDHMRQAGREYYLDTPVMTLRLEGVERAREITSQMDRKYRVSVFEVARWFYRTRNGAFLTRGRCVNL